ncbi:MAG TPA: alginate lyase family protein [Candidatus Sulfotelmatobacter sp.]|nr:alginate lyase family protein [Candidatus Sulfotelmatobacter sp.]
MNDLVEKVRRLREMDATEMRFRISQKLRIGRERWEIAFGDGNGNESAWWEQWNVARVTDDGLREFVTKGDDAGAAGALAEYLARRTVPAFFWDVPQRDELVREFKLHFPGRIDEIRTEAEAICEHRFRVFGYPEVRCGAIIPWHRDLVHGQEAARDHYSLVPTLDFGSVGDSKIVWELSRHQQFFVLCQAYLLTGEERFAEECLAQWEDWLQQNPYRRGINWASSLEVAFRSWSWTWMLYFLLGSKALTGERLGLLTQALGRNAEFIRENISTYFAPNTHLIGEAFALFVTGVLLPELHGAETWCAQGQNILAEQMERQVRDDGSHFEQSTFYHRYAIEFFLAAAILADRNGVPFDLRYKSKLQTMLEYLACTAFPNGEHPAIGDSDGGRLLPFGVFNAEDHRPVLSTAAIYFQRGDFLTAKGFDEQALWLMGLGAEPQFRQLQSAGPSTASRTFRDAGVITMRSDGSRDAKFLLFDAGPQGVLFSGHGHADALSFVCGANGTNWLIDPGTFVYSSSREWRDFFRSTAAHNTLAIDDQDQAIRVDWFKWRELPEVTLEESVSLPAMDYAVASHNGYERLSEPVTHRREIVFAKPDYWVIADELIGQGRHKIKAFFHFGPGITVERWEQGWLARKGTEQFLLVPLTDEMHCEVMTGQESPIQGWYSKDYGHREPSAVVVGEIEATLPKQFRWLLLPVVGNVPTVQRRSSDCSVSVVTDKWSDLITWKPPEIASAPEQPHTDAALAIARTGQATGQDKLVVLGGSRLQRDGKAVLSAEKRFEYLTAEWKINGLEIAASPAHSFRLLSDPVATVLVNGEKAKYSEDAGAVIVEGET